MRLVAYVVLAIAPLGTVPLPAQTPSAPRLYLSMFGGYRPGREIWTLDDQPFQVFLRTSGGLQPNPGQEDTLDLQQHTVSGFVIGAGGTYFPSPQVGLDGQIAFLGLGLESRCAIRRFTQPSDTADINPELCTSLNGATTSLSAVSFSAGVVARLRPDKATYPYLRASVGFVARTRSTVEMTGVYTDRAGVPTPVTVVGDTKPNKTAPSFTLGVGAAFSLGPSYQLRLEGQHLTTRLDRVTGQADPAGGTLYPPHTGRMYQSFLFTVAVDVVLEQRRGRRY